MPFTLSRPNATKWDLGDDLKYFEQARTIASGYGKLGIFRDAVLVNLIEKYGGEKVCLIMDRFCSRQMTSLDRFVSLVEGRESLEFVAAPRANETPGAGRTREEGSVRRLQDIADDIMAKPKQKPSAPIPDGVMTKRRAISWMNENGYDLERWDELFQYYGQSTNGEECFLLLQRRQE